MIDPSRYRPCVGIMLVNRDGQLFVGQRIDSTAEAWQMPQGGIDPGEEPATAALRELEEETGVRPHHVRIIAATAGEHHYDLPQKLAETLWKGQYLGQRQRWFLMALEAGDEAIDIRTAHPEFRAWRWVGPEALDAMIVPFKRALYADVLAELVPLISSAATARAVAKT